MNRAPLLVALGMILIGAVGFLFWRSSQKQTAATADKSCRTSMRTILSAIEMYRGENHRPPERLDQLIPRYLDKLPPCPVARKETYTTTYQVYGQKYTFFCRGHYHQRENHPLFNSVKGWD